MHSPIPDPGSPSPLGSLDYGGDLPHPSDPVGRSVREFFANNWTEARDGLLARTTLIDVTPLHGEVPRSFSFAIDRPYRRRQPSGSIILDPGPVEGVICYHASVLRPPPDVRPVVVFISSAGFHHPNVGRKHHVLCLGDVPLRLPLDALLQHLYGVVAYQNLGFNPPLDPEAARYFLTNPAAFEGLRPVPPLY